VSRLSEVTMSESPHPLPSAAQDEPLASEQLLPLVYDELRRLAAQKVAQEQPGQTLQATALVHEAYLRLVSSAARSGEPPRWQSKGHFFAAAAEAMRRILVEKARRKRRLRHAGGAQRESLEDNEPAITSPVDGVDLLALNEALDQLESVSPRRAQLVKLRYFGGFTLPEAAGLLGVSQSTAEADWTYAKAWLKRSMEKS
jgi:RNA polymerase sigma factor (TIGR02999 family)